MNRFNLYVRQFTILSIATLLVGCKGIYLRYTYECALQSLPECSRVQAINNDYITYSVVEPKTTNKSDYINLVTNLYQAHYTSNGKIYKTVLYTTDAK
jgi:hypothetical protein